MTNLTVAIDEAVLLRARRRALETGTSVNAVVREYLSGYAGSDDELQTRRALLRMAAESTASSGPGARSWTRDELHER